MSIDPIRRSIDKIENIHSYNKYNFYKPELGYKWARNY